MSGEVGTGGLNIVDRDRDRDKKPGRPLATATPEPERHEAHAAHNPALGEIYEQLVPQITNRHRPNQDAITAALHAMQRLATEMDSEQAAEDTADATVMASSKPCPACGHSNRPGNKFCGMCGLSVDDSPIHAESVAAASPLIQSQPPQGMPEIHPASGAAGATHHYHHHYHHHYLPAGGGYATTGADPGLLAARPNAHESAREADRMRIAAAAKGEPMTRGEAAVRRLTQEWVLACNTRQLDELLDLYAPDALVLRSNLPTIRGAGAVREFFFSALEAGLGEVSVEPMRVEVLGDLAHEVGRYSALVPGTTGKRREERGKYLWVFAKQSSGDWKLVSECWSADLTITGAESDVPKFPGPSSSKGLPRKGV
jgi:uncharacterized protein (TIGR02246 family)